MIEREPGKLPEKANSAPQHLKGLPKAPNGPSALEMLTRHIDGDTQEEPHLTEEFWYASAGMAGPDAPQHTEPDQEGPRGASWDEAEPGD